MGQGIHPGGRGQLRRQGQGHARIQHGGAWHQEFGNEQHLHPLFGIGDHGRVGGFRAGPGRGGHSKEGTQRAGQRLGAAEIPHILPIERDEDIDALGRIQHRAATHGDDRIALFGAEQPGQLVHDQGRRFERGLVVEGADGDAALGKRVQDDIYQPGFGHAFVGDDQRAPDIGLD